LEGELPSIFVAKPEGIEPTASWMPHMKTGPQALKYFGFLFWSQQKISDIGGVLKAFG
jgi:hypothetical protein